MYIIPGRKLIKEEQKNSIFLASILSTLLLAGLLIFIFFPLTEYDIYPKCPTYEFTKTHCPGCGTMRGINGVLNGNFKALITYNIFAAFALPFLLYHFCVLLWGAITGYRLPLPGFSGPELIGLAIFIVLYWILRNFIPFLAPHG